MRINYYRFPESVDPHTRFINGAAFETGECETGRTTCRGCTVGAGAWAECEHFRCTVAETVILGCSITTAKQLLKKFGGVAWTEHCERDGSVFEVTSIELGKNNSRFKYNHHL